MEKNSFRYNKLTCQFCQYCSLGVEFFQKYLYINENNFEDLITDIKMQTSNLKSLLKVKVWFFIFLSPSLSSFVVSLPVELRREIISVFMVTSLESIITHLCTPTVHDYLSEGLSITVFFPWTVTTIEYYWFSWSMMIQRLDSSGYGCFITFMSNKLKCDFVDDKPQVFSAL